MKRAIFRALDRISTIDPCLMPEEVDDLYDRPWFLGSRPLEYFQEHMTTLGRLTVEMCIKFDRPDVLRWTEKFDHGYTELNLMLAIELGRAEICEHILEKFDLQSEYAKEIVRRAFVCAPPAVYAVLKRFHLTPEGSFLGHDRILIDMQYSDQHWIDMKKMHVETLDMYLDERKDEDGFSRELENWANLATAFGRAEIVESIMKRETVKISIWSIIRCKDVNTIDKAIAHHDVDEYAWRRAIHQRNYYLVMYLLDHYPPPSIVVNSNMLENLIGIARMHGKEACILADRLRPWLRFDVYSEHILYHYPDELEFLERIGFDIKGHFEKGKIFFDLLLFRLAARRWDLAYFRAHAYASLILAEDINQCQEILPFMATKVDTLYRIAHLLTWQTMCAFIKRYPYLVRYEQLREIFRVYPLAEIDPEIIRQVDALGLREFGIKSIAHGRFDVADWLIMHGLINVGLNDLSGPGEFKGRDTAMTIYTAVNRYGLTRGFFENMPSSVAKDLEFTIARSPKFATYMCNTFGGIAVVLRAIHETKYHQRHDVERIINECAKSKAEKEQLRIIYAVHWDRPPFYPRFTGLGSCKYGY